MCAFCFALSTTIHTVSFLLCIFCICSYCIDNIHTSTFFLQLWVYTYFSALALEPVDEVPLTVPLSQVYDGQLCRKTRESFMFFR